ncbi:glucose-6-phosphate isomerase [Pelagibacterales bacterium SAG-MED39]|nr:glucose-6-phosphate isomerase [Pelagibacterales bacterium SAG-MED39]
MFLKNFKNKRNTKNVYKDLLKILSSKNEILNSLSIQYNYSYSNKLIVKFKKNFSSLRIIGMGGSTNGMKAIYSFLKYKIAKKILFVDNLVNFQKNKKAKNCLNLIISKSGNTLETISNTNLLINRGQKNIFITDKKDSYLRKLAMELRSEIIDHNNFIGGRYSVLSEVGMLPSSLIGLQEKKFKQFNSLVKNKKFINSLVLNTASIIYFIKKKFNSIIINYDENSDDLFRWYQQLVAESLGKKQKGILPVISSMPKDNHSLMQLYLDGPKNNFFTFFNIKENKSDRLINNRLLKSHYYLKNKNLNQVLESQKKATEKVFKDKRIPFRSFQVFKRSEETLGELFSFFILETILIGKVMKIDPYNQPSVELIKENTKKNLKNF